MNLWTNLASTALFVALTAAPATPTAAQQGDAGLDGAWTLTFASPQGTVNLDTTLRQDGAILKGESGSALGFATAFGEGRVEGTDLTFEIHVEVNGEWYTLYFTGELEDEEIVGKVDIPDGSSASFRGRRST